MDGKHDRAAADFAAAARLEPDDAKFAAAQKKFVAPTTTPSGDLSAGK
jgi:hypothetical protein